MTDLDFFQALAGARRRALFSEQAANRQPFAADRIVRSGTQLPWVAGALQACVTAYRPSRRPTPSSNSATRDALVRVCQGLRISPQDLGKAVAVSERRA